MKILNIYIIVLFSLMVLSSCDKELTLNPFDSLSENVVLSTDANVKNVLNGAFRQARRDAIYGGNILRNAELLAGDGEIVWVGTFFGPRQIFNKSIIAENEDITAQWLDAYRVINSCNNVLSPEALAVVNEADKKRVEGQAIFLRALTYFDLVRFYAKPYEAGSNNNQPGVPLVTTPTRGISAANSVARNTVEEVYNFVISELTKATTLLQDVTNTGVYPSAGAAQALLARVYLQKGDFPNARDAANNVISSGKYQLRPNYAAIFNKDVPTTEDIFAIEFTPNDGANSMTIFWSIPEFGGRQGDIEILDGHLNLYSSQDDRGKLFYDGNAGIRSGKWNNQFGVVHILRLAEMHLIRAEANERLSTTVGATPLDDINLLRSRANADLLNSVSLSDIILERRLELAHEGHKIHDIKRLKGSVGTRNYNDPKLVFPIPARELQANTNLSQNDTY